MISIRNARLRQRGLRARIPLPHRPAEKALQEPPAATKRGIRLYVSAHLKQIVDLAQDLPPRTLNLRVSPQ